MNGLCLKSLSDVIAGRVTAHPYFETDAYVVMIPVGDKSVHFLGDAIKPFDAGKAALFRELYGCAQRFIALLEKLREDPDHAGSLQTLRETIGTIPVP